MHRHFYHTRLGFAFPQFSMNTCRNNFRDSSKVGACAFSPTHSSCHCKECMAKRKSDFFFSSCTADLSHVRVNSQCFDISTVSTKCLKLIDNCVHSRLSLLRHCCSPALSKIPLSFSLKPIRLSSPLNITLCLCLSGLRSYKPPPPNHNLIPKGNPGI